jgi:hypothetical protein
MPGCWATGEKGKMTRAHGNLFSLNPKVSLITGAARGIGRSMAIGLAEAGSDLMLFEFFLKQRLCKDFLLCSKRVLTFYQSKNEFFYSLIVFTDRRILGAVWFCFTPCFSKFWIVSEKRVFDLIRHAINRT